MPYPYNDFQYLTPPQAEVQKSAVALPLHEGMGWFAQVKKNGTHSVIFVDPNRNVDAWDRHGEQQKAWHFTAATAAVFRALPGNKWYVFDGELLHNKTSHIKDVLYLYDMLVWNGSHLTGTTYEYRYNVMLATLYAVIGRAPPRIKPGQDHYAMHRHVWLARNFKKGFRALFDSLSAPEDEGLVLRDPQGVYYTSNADRWMLKVKRA